MSGTTEKAVVNDSESTIMSTEREKVKSRPGKRRKSTPRCPFFAHFTRFATTRFSHVYKLLRFGGRKKRITFQIPLRRLLPQKSNASTCNQIDADFVTQSSSLVRSITPFTPLVVASNRRAWTATEQGSCNGGGVVFQITSASNVPSGCLMVSREYEINGRKYIKKSARAQQNRRGHDGRIENPHLNSKVPGGEKNIGENSTGGQVVTGKKCACCGSVCSPLWREGPACGAQKARVLCNACGIRYRKYNIICAHCSYVPTKQEHEQMICRKCSRPYHS